MMTATKRRPKAEREATDHKTAAERMAQLVIDAIDRGDTVPWQKGWVVDGIWPSNPISGTVYKGINPLMLGLYAAADGWESPYWVTFKQMVAKGGKFNRDAKGLGRPVVFWNQIVKPDPDDADKRRKFGFWRVYSVFNVDIVDGLTLPEQEKREPVALNDALKGLQQGYEGGPKIRHLPSAQAYYMSSLHQITLPTVDQFLSTEAYAETLSHELCHSTGHESLLDRNMVGWNCRQDYAKEELVAEIGSAMVLQMLGLDVDVPRTADYVAGWRKAIHDDPNALLSAASKAYRAACVVTGFNDTKEDSDE